MWELAINDRSDFILVQDLAAVLGTPSDRPAFGVFTLSGGDNGLTDLADAGFIGDPSQHTGLLTCFDEIDALKPADGPRRHHRAGHQRRGIAYAVGARYLLFIADMPTTRRSRQAVDFRKGQGMYSHAAFNPPATAALDHPLALEISDPVNSRKKPAPPAARWRAASPAATRRGTGTRPPVLTVAASSTRLPGLQDQPWRARCAILGRGQCHRVPHTGINIGARRRCKASPRPWTASTCRLMMYMEEAIGIFPLRGVRAEPSPDLALPSAA